MQSVADLSVDTGGGMAIFMGWGDDDVAMSGTEVAGLDLEEFADSGNDSSPRRSEGSARVWAVIARALVAFVAWRLLFHVCFAGSRESAPPIMGSTRSL